MMDQALFTEIHICRLYHDNVLRLELTKTDVKFHGGGWYR